MQTFLFYLFGAIALLAALNVIRLRKVFHAALSLIVCLCSMAGIYLILDAGFIAAVQIIVYAGAIMVLFLFVIMLLDPFSGANPVDKKKSLRIFAWVLGGAWLLLLIPLLRFFDPARASHNVLVPPGGIGNVAVLADSLFKKYLLPFEVTSIVILVAIVGAIVLAKKQL
jgi:NADH-quinone oxidoreductase subunit J